MCTQISSFSGGKKEMVRRRRTKRKIEKCAPQARQKENEENARRRRAKRKNEGNARRRRAKSVKGGPEGPPFYLRIYKKIQTKSVNLNVFFEKKTLRVVIFFVWNGKVPPFHLKEIQKKSQIFLES